jgi:hypothetical protein
MILNKILTAYVGDKGVGKIYLGDKLIFPNEVNFNLSWNTNNVIVTAYSPIINENDRPRINTWRSDDDYVVYLSAGYVVYDKENTGADITPWGDRTTGSTVITLSLTGTLFCGIDLFTDKRLTEPVFVPSITNWVSSQASDINETKWQYIVTRDSNDLDPTISITLPQGW